MTSSILGRVRLALSRGFARFLVVVGMLSFGPLLIRRARESSLFGTLFKWLLGIHSTFGSLEEAEKYVTRYVPTGHAHSGQRALQVAMAETTRESDYPMLFFLAPLGPDLRSVFDLGGGIGNVFFELDRHLHFSSQLVWKIHDLPSRKQSALDFAKLKNENRIVVMDDLSAASGVDLFLVVGAIHYFESSLADMLRTLEKLPKHVIVNRSPFSNGDDIIAVQDARTLVIPCKLHSTAKFLEGMQGLEYELVADWPVHERRLRVPLYPEYRDPYRGFYFRLRNEDPEIATVKH